MFVIVLSLGTHHLIRGRGEEAIEYLQKINAF